LPGFPVDVDVFFGPGLIAWMVIGFYLIIFICLDVTRLKSRGSGAKKS
jgi:hypothetical protein